MMNYCNKSNCKECKSGLCCTEIHNLSVKKGNQELLRDVNLHIHCGELTALIGKNGAGKSTLLKAILGENKFSGKLNFIDGNNQLSRKPKIGYVPQKLDFDYSSPVSVSDLFGATISDRPVFFKSNDKLRQKTLDSLKKVRAEHLIDKKLGFLSGGELQRVLLALALDPIPEILLLDEPVSGVDQNGMKLFYEVVSELRVKYDLSIILVSHDLNLVNKYADRVAFINNKTIECVGSPKEVFSNDNVLESFGLNFSLGYNAIKEV